MRILAVTNMLPTASFPSSGTFVEQQVAGLRHLGLPVNVLFLDRRQAGMRVYSQLQRQLRKEISEHQPDIVHVMYGGVMAELVTRAVRDRVTIVESQNCALALLPRQTPTSRSFPATAD